VAFSFPLPLLKEMDYSSCHIITLISVNDVTTTNAAGHTATIGGINGIMG